MAHRFLLPDIGEGLTEAEIVRWHVAVGDVVTVDQILCEIETAKSVVELPSPHEGIVLAVGGAEGETISVGELLVAIGDPEEVVTGPDLEPPVPRQDPAADVPGSASGARSGTSVKAVPVVRKLARERGIDLTTVVGSGPGGAITRSDVLAATGGGGGAAAADAGSPTEERVRLSRLRRTIAEHMTASWREIPHVTTFDDMDGSGLLDAWQNARELTEGALPLEALLVAAIVPALIEFPEFNAAVDGEYIVLKRHYDVGVAVDTPQGLIVPVVRRADQMPLEALGARITDLARRARSRTLRPDEVVGATFTLSNIGALGGGHGSPIIPLGTTAILSVGLARDKPIVRDGSVVVAPIVPLSLSYDHRAIDGGLGRRFVDRVIALMTDPAQAADLP